MNNIITIYDEKYQVKCEHTYNANNQPVIEIFEEDGCPAGVITVCLPRHSFKDGETAISGDVPQDEVVQQLESIGIVENTGKTANSGFGFYPVVKLIAAAQA